MTAGTGSDIGSSDWTAGTGSPGISGHRVTRYDSGHWVARHQVIWQGSGHRVTRHWIVWLDSGHRVTRYDSGHWVTRHQVIWLASGHRVIWQGSELRVNRHDSEH
ncbi:unnamed protein product, partial [Staurois parvus]